MKRTVRAGNSFAHYHLIFFTLFMSSHHTLTDKSENILTIYTLWACVCIWMYSKWDKMYACGRIHTSMKTSPFNRNKILMWFMQHFTSQLWQKHLHIVRKIRKINRYAIQRHTRVGHGLAQATWQSIRWLLIATFTSYLSRSDAVLINTCNVFIELSATVHRVYNVHGFFPFNYPTLTLHHWFCAIYCCFYNFCLFFFFALNCALWRKCF